METAPEIIARKFLNRTNRHLFLTGRAGTGKTTFLRQIIEETHKKAVIAAPTGVAAINAGGVTLHSLFQLPFGTYIPSDSYEFSDNISGEVSTSRTLMRNLHMHSTKRRLIQELELLIIDEVSMLRADILDAIDKVLRSVRRQRGVPFGGVQILFIGDLLQLPPVVKDDEWMILRSFYKSIHFFEALALQGDPPIYLELEKIYRQTDPVFIKLLNHFRDSQVDNHDIEILNSHYKPGFKPKPKEGYIYLTTHNRIADRINHEELEKLSVKSFKYEAEINKDFRENIFPVDLELELKTGAQVMFIKNDVSGYGRFFNGKIGSITELQKDEIEVSFNDGSDPVLVEKHIWYNKKYKLDASDNEIKEEVMGTFTQYPLKLAWAVTVHKSQGLTFEKAIIDVENAFAPGQIYVALSRLISLDGLVLSSPVPTSGFVKDSNIAAFAESKTPEEQIEPILEYETHRFIRQKLIQYFDFTDLEEAFSYHLRSYTKDEKRSAKQRFKQRILDIQASFFKEKEIADKFKKQVLDISANPSEGYLDILHDRVSAALAYFEPKLKGLSALIMLVIDELKDAIGVKAFIKEMHELEAHFYSKLQSLRKSVALIEAIRKNVDLVKSEYTKEGEKEARTIAKPGKKSSPRQGPGKKKKGSKTPGEKKPKGHSAKLSYEMFTAGKSIPEIAKEREMVISTIESHLGSFVEKGELDILKVIDEDKISEIRSALKKHYKDSIMPVKRALGESYSFGEIRMVIAENNRSRITEKT
jgi:nucleoside-triphosphatase THEP1